MDGQTHSEHAVKSFFRRGRLISKLPSFVFPAQLPSLTFTPHRYRPNGIGYWSGHIPFACDLIYTLRPAVFVELGTHLGESYFAFCQAIAESEVPCQAFAVDTWGGDAHTGAYSDEVFAEVNDYNAGRYSRFSRLFRMRFDGALDHFPAQSIDLLHIDGEHTCGAVRHDFDCWWPKVKPGGVVILHDAAEKGHDFGVWKLLEELRKELPVAEFTHSHGLGVIVKPPFPQGGNVATALVEADANRLGQMRRYYEICADHLQMQFLRARQARGAEWEVTSQVFWRGPDENFTEANSMRLAHIVGVGRSTVLLKVPPSSEPYAGFRLALTLLPALLQLHSITVLNVHGQPLWTADAARDVAHLQNGGLHAVAAADGESALILDSPSGSQTDLTLPDSLGNELQAGGAFRLEMSGLDPYAFASRLLSAQESRIAEFDRELQEQERKADRIEKSFAWRVLRPLIR